MEFIESHRDELPELETIDEQRRLYPRNGFAANLIGYVGEVSDDMLNDPRFAYYEPGDVVGKSGVEQSYDQLLRGQDGSQDIIVDSHGREVGILGREPAVPGQGLKLTIDLDIQRAAEAAMGDHNGAIVAIDPHTGAVLALVSRPSFRPQRLLGACLARRMEQAHHRSAPSAAGQGNSGPAGAGIHVQDHHVAGRPGERCRAEFEGGLQRGRHLLRSLLWLR